MSVIYNTIKILLPFGELRGIRVAEGEYNSNISLIEIPRGKMAQFYTMPEADAQGIYFLICKAAAGQKPLLYIGQTGDFRSRFKQHEATKPLWYKAFAVVLKNNFRTLDHLAYIEAKAIQTALSAGSCVLENGTAGNKTRHIHDSIRHASEVIFQEIDTLLAVFNQPVFEPFEGGGLAARPSEKNDRNAVLLQTA